MKYDAGDLSPYSKVTCRLVCPEYKVKDEQGNIVTKKLVSKSITFRTLPNPTTIVKTSRSKNAVRLYWVKQKYCAGYKIQKYNTKTKKWETAKTIKDFKVTNARVSGLKPGTKYKFRIKTYGYVGSKKFPVKTKNGAFSNVIYGHVSKTVMVTTKK